MSVALHKYKYFLVGILKHFFVLIFTEVVLFLFLKKKGGTMNTTEKVLSDLQSYNSIETQYANDILEYESIIQGVPIINIFHMNIRSIQRNFEELLILLDNCQNEFDIIILTETWQFEAINNFHIPNYTFYYNNANFNQNDGVVVYIHNSIRTINVSNIRDNEVTFTKILGEKSNKKFNITAIYRPPSTNSHIFLDDLNKIITENYQVDIEFLIGDINLDINDTNNGLVQEYLNYLSASGYYPQINKSTRETNISSSCLDHIFFKNKKNFNFKILPCILKCSITDHYATILTLTKSQIISNECSKTQLSEYQKIDEVKLMKTLEHEKWDDICNQTDIEIATNKFITKFKHLIRSCSKTLYNKVKSTQKLKPWITQGLIKSIQVRDKLKQRLIQQPNNIILEQNYKRYRNLTTKLIRKTKHDYYKIKIQEADKDIKKVWTIIKESTNEIKTQNKIDKIKLENDTITVNKIEICNAYNKYFSEIGRKMAEEIIDNNLQNAHYEQNINFTLNSIFLHPVSETEIINCINNLKKDGTPGIDKIRASDIKKSCQYILKPLKHIINLVFVTGKFPEILKKAVIKPILKTGDPLEINNYRPISLISNFAKIIEKCIKFRLLEHINKYNLISPFQFGFKEKMSTVDATYALTHEIYHSLNTDQKPLAIFLDLAKAFDTVSHNKLLDKLNNYGIRGICNDLIRDYLTNRKQVVSIDSVYSEERQIEYGVPQGTVLGPILFQLYINDMLNLEISGEIISYADDTVLIFSGSTWQNVKIKAERGLFKIKQWLNNNLLTLNKSKTKFIAFSLNVVGQTNINIKYHNCNNPSTCDCSNVIDRADQIKYLGIYIDQFLKWNYHIEKLNGKLRKLLYKFYQLRNILNIKTLVTVYKTLIESLIKYGIVIWGAAYDTILANLKVIQKHFIKIIYKKPKQYSTKLLFEESKLQDIDTIYIISSLNYIKKNTKLQNYLPTFYTTRSQTNMNFVTPKPYKTAFVKSIDYTGIKLFNILPPCIKEITTNNRFKKDMAKYVCENIENFKNVLKS